MTRARTALALGLAAAALAAEAGAQATPSQALDARDRARRTAEAASARNRAASGGGAPAARPTTPPAAPPAAAGASPAPAPTAAGSRRAAQQPRAVPDSATEVSQRGAKGELTFRREIYAYDAGGRRDPFVSLMASGDLRPVISELRVATILHDPSGRNSIAILRDVETKEQFRVRVGQTLGRMRVTRIEPRRVTFTIDEFGFSRQEALTLGDTTNARTP